MTAPAAPSVAVHLSLPLGRSERGTTVLAAAIALFGPADFVRFVVTPSDGRDPTADDAAEFTRLCERLADGAGPLPRMTLTSEAQAAREPVLMSLSAAGDPTGDARAVLVLEALARKLGSAFARTSDPVTGQVPRGGEDGMDLARLDAAAAQLRRRFTEPPSTTAPLHLGVLVRQPHYWGALHTIVLAGQQHPDVLVDVTLLVDADPRAAERASQFAHRLAATGVELHDEAWLRGNLHRLDVVLCAEGYDIGRPEGLTSRELAATGARLVLSPYAQSLLGHPDNCALLFNLAVHNIAWRIYVASDEQRANYARYCGAGDTHVRYLGNVKRERLLTDTAATEAASVLRAQVATESIVLWNAHFDDPYGMSTFRLNASAIVGFFAEHPDRGLIARPHPKLLADYERLGGQAATAAQDFRRLCARLPNVHLDETVDPAPAMLAADAMISDLSSMIPEYQVLGRPVGLLRAKPAAVLNADQGFLSGVVTVDDTTEVTAFLSDPTGPTVAVDRALDIGAGARIVATILDDWRAEQFGTAAR